MKKRLLSAFLALAMLFSVFPTAFATTSYNEDTGKFDANCPIEGLHISVDKDGNVTGISVEPNSLLSAGNIIVSIFTTTQLYYTIYMDGENSYETDKLADNYNDNDYGTSDAFDDPQLPRVKYEGKVSPSGGNQALSEVSASPLSAAGIIACQTAVEGTNLNPIMDEEDEDYGFNMVYSDADGEEINTEEALAQYIEENGGYTVDIYVVNQSR
jgi:hypothetical protein